MVEEISTGGCHCGAVRYEISGDPLWKSMCFCHICTRTVGAPIVAWVGFPINIWGRSKLPAPLARR